MLKREHAIQSVPGTVEKSLEDCEADIDTAEFAALKT